MRNENVALDPANSLIQRLGGPDEVRKITNASRTRIYRWTQPKDRGGTGGVIPPAHARKLLEHARLNGIEASADEFLGMAGQ